MYLWCTPKRYISENPVQTPHVLILEPGTRTVLIHLNCDHIFSGLQVVGEVKISSIPAVHTETYFLTIYP